MTEEDLLLALKQELEEYSSLHVRYIMYDPIMIGKSLRVKKVGYDRPMIITVSNGFLYCRVLIKRDDDRMTTERGGKIDLADPKAIEQLLALLKKDLR